MRLADSANLAMRIAVIAPSRYRIALQRGLCPHVFLEGIEAMQLSLDPNCCRAVVPGRFVPVRA